MLDVIAGLDGICQFFVVAAGVLHTLEFGTIQTDSLGDLVNALAPVFPAQENINIHTFTGVDQRGHPACPNHTWIAVTLDVKKGIIKAIHHDVVMMVQINTAGCQKV